MYHQGIIDHRKCTLITNPVYDKTDVMIEFNMNEGLGGIVAPGMDKLYGGNFLLRSTWPFPKDHSHFLAMKKAGNLTYNVHNFHLLEEEELIICGSSRSVYLWRGGKLHPFDGLDSFKQRGRDFSEVVRYSAKLSLALTQGHPVTLQALKQYRMPTDKYWTEEEGKRTASAT